MSAETAAASRSSLGTGAAEDAKRGWGRVVTIIVLLFLVLAGSAAAYYKYVYLEARNPRMFVVNGLDLPMTVQVGSRSFHLPARSYVSDVYEPGSYDLTVTTAGEGSGQEIAREQLALPEFTDVVVYNIAGIALLRDSSVTFHCQPERDPEACPPDANAALQREDIAYPVFQTYTTRDEVEYVFEAPPEEIRVRGEPIREVQRFFGVPKQMDFDIPWQWDGTVSYLANYRHQFNDALHMLREVIRLDPTNVDVRTASRVMLRNCIKVDFFPRPWISFCAEDLGQVLGLGQSICAPVLGERCTTPSPFPVPPPGQVSQPGQPGQAPIFPPAFDLVRWWPRLPPPIDPATIDSSLAPTEGTGVQPNPTL